MHNHGLPAARCGATESRVEGYARVGCKATDKRPDQQNPGVCRIDQIKTYPGVSRRLFVQALGDTLHDGLGSEICVLKTLKLSEQLFMYRHHVVIGR